MSNELFQRDKFCIELCPLQFYVAFAKSTLGSCCSCVDLNPPYMMKALQTCLFKETWALFICIGQSFQ